MSEKLITALVTIATAIVGVAVIAVLVSPQAQTGNVINASAGGFAQLLCKATSPITGASCGTSVTSTINFGGIRGAL
jgi:PRD1 phage membrane DNA delivery